MKPWMEILEMEASHPEPRFAGLFAAITVLSVSLGCLWFLVGFWHYVFGPTMTGWMVVTAVLVFSGLATYAYRQLSRSESESGCSPTSGAIVLAAFATAVLALIAAPILIFGEIVYATGGVALLLMLVVASVCYCMYGMAAGG